MIYIINYINKYRMQNAGFIDSNYHFLLVALFALI